MSNPVKFLRAGLVLAAFLGPAALVSPALVSGAQASEKKEGPVSLSVPITNLTLPLLLEDRSMVGRLDLVLDVQATDAAAVTRIEEQLPRIRDLLLTRVTPAPIPGSSNVSAETLTDMKSRILALLREVVGADAVKAVYIVKAMTRRS